MENKKKQFTSYAQETLVVAKWQKLGAKNI
jgi:hypothetical protein